MPKHLATTLLLLFFLSGCDNPGSDTHLTGAHDHSNALEHDHSDDDEHIDRSLYLTHFTDQSELFLQYEPLVAKRDSVFFAHFTRLSDYMPIPDGFITITLSGGGTADEIFTGRRPVRDGIHIEIATPQHAAERQLSVKIESPTVTTTHILGNVTVYPTLAVASQSTPRSRPDETRYLSKEAQWQANFLVQRPVADRQQRLSLPTTAIHHTDKGQIIYVMRTAEFFERRSIITGATHGDRIEIIDGILESERVVIRGGKIFLPHSG